MTAFFRYSISLSLFFTLTNAHAAAVTKNPIPRFLKVADGVYRGGTPGVEGVAYLKQLGFKTILNLESSKETLRREEEAAKKHGIHWVSNPITLFSLPDDDEIDEMIKLMADPKNLPIFVHCKAGRDRTGMMLGIYRVEVQKWGPAHAWQEMLALGFRRIYFPLSNIFKRRTGYWD